MRSDTAALFGRTYSRRAHEYSTEWPQHAGSAGPPRLVERFRSARALLARGAGPVRTEWFRSAQALLARDAGPGRTERFRSARALLGKRTRQ